jgi:very-short-patch-repair endonuclease
VVDPAAALDRLGGVSATAALLALTSRRRLRDAVRRGQVARVGRDRYALPTAERAMSAAMAVNGYITHLSAAAHWGWEIAHQPDLSQVAVPRRRPRSFIPGVELHHLDLQLEDVEGLAVNRLQTVLLCARDESFRDALAVADSALRHGDLDHGTLVRAAAATGSARVLRVAQHANARAANPFESVLRAIAIDAGLEMVPQYAIRSGALLLHPDLADPLRGVVLEADSWGWHADKVAHDRDCVRYNALTVAGWVVLRFTWSQVMQSPAYVTSTLRTLMAELDARTA